MPIAKETTGGIARAPRRPEQAVAAEADDEVTLSEVLLLDDVRAVGHTARISALISSRSGVRRR